MSEKPLFVPLKREHFEAFERGDKTEEYRVYGPRWNENTCRIGRAVTLSLGYSGRRLTGVVRSFERGDRPCKRPEWVAIYGDQNDAACIGIDLQ